ncbi:MAG TPA: efflux RND transporter periplasmic adaptor subunit [Stenotrophomonas sp.]|nr:efflux RND transporter periplasmic adaptor subunit [Stenotrophomonas sp.]
MNIKNNRLWVGVALVVALAGGFGLARLTNGASRPPAAAAEEHADGAHDEAQAPGKAGEGTAKQGAAGGDEGVIVLTPQQIAASGIEVVSAGRGGGHETRLSGRVESAVGARASVAAAVGGRVERVLVAPGSVVKVGQSLAVVLSGEAATMRANADAARAEAEVARLAYKRDQTLSEQGVVARQEYEASRARSLAADATVRAAQARVKALGGPDSLGRMNITSPVDGIVGVVQVTPGGFVNAGDLVATVSDPAKTELVFSAPPALVDQVRAGTRIEVTGPTSSFSATVIGVAADVREQSGVAIIRARADAGTLPPAGAPVAGVVVATDSVAAITVPSDAVQTVAGSAAVFVATDKGFRVTPILAGRRAGGNVEILEGLKGGERIASTNAFLLKAELAKGEAEHGH